MVYLGISGLRQINVAGPGTEEKGDTITSVITEEKKIYQPQCLV